jgi:hypothetical protein
VPTLAAEVPAGVQRPGEAGGAHLEGVAPGDRVGFVQGAGEVLGDQLDDVGLDRLLGVEDHAEHPPTALTTEVELQHLDPVAAGHPIGKFLDMRR